MDTSDEEIMEIDDIDLDDFELEKFPDLDEQDLRATPYRIMLMFTGGDTGDDSLDKVAEYLIKEGVARGLFFEFSMGTEMDLDEVDPKSGLYEIITGREVPK